MKISVSVTVTSRGGTFRSALCYSHPDDANKRMVRSSVVNTHFVKGVVLMHEMENGT